jgi:hypothetical protein
MHLGAVVPTNTLVTEIMLSQLSQLSQEDEAREEEAATLADIYRLDEIQASFSLLMPTFKKIVSVLTDRNSRMLDKAFSAFRV